MFQVIKLFFSQLQMYPSKLKCTLLFCSSSSFSSASGLVPALTQVIPSEYFDSLLCKFPPPSFQIGKPSLISFSLQTTFLLCQLTPCYILSTEGTVEKLETRMTRGEIFLFLFAYPYTHLHKSSSPWQQLLLLVCPTIPKIDSCLFEGIPPKYQINWRAPFLRSLKSNSLGNLLYDLNDTSTSQMTSLFRGLNFSSIGSFLHVLEVSSPAK